MAIQKKTPNDFGRYFYGYLFLKIYFEINGEQGPTVRVKFMAGGAQWRPVAPGGAQWRKSAAVGGGKECNFYNEMKGVAIIALHVYSTIYA